MISRSDLKALRESFESWNEPGLPVSLAAHCARLLHVSDMTISFVGASDQLTLSTSSDESHTLGKWEFTLQEGPCFDAGVRSTSKTADTAASITNPWPRLSVKAQAIGYRSIAGVPLRVGETTFATLNFQDRNGTITPETLSDAEEIARELASLVIGSLQEPPSLDQPAEHDAFHQATGMVMAQMGIDALSAADVLRAHAWSHDRLLMDTAFDVVARILSFLPTDW